MKVDRNIQVSSMKHQKSILCLNNELCYKIYISKCIYKFIFNTFIYLDDNNK